QLELAHALVHGSEQEHPLDALHGAQRGGALREVALEDLDLGWQHGSRRPAVAHEGAHATSTPERLTHDLEAVRSGGAGDQHRHETLLSLAGADRSRRLVVAWAPCLTPSPGISAHRADAIGP